MIQKINIDAAYNPHNETSCLAKEQYVPVYNVINELLSPTSVADLGCRVGHLITLFKEKNNIDVLGVDYFQWNKDAADNLIKDQFLVHDLRDPLKLEKTYDVVVSTEVGEHIDKAYSVAYLENIKSVMTKTSRLVMTWAPGVPCDQHLNPLERADFFNHMQSNGFNLKDELTSKAVSLAAEYGVFNTFHWYHTGNLSVWQLA